VTAMATPAAVGRPVSAALPGLPRRARPVGHAARLNVDATTRATRRQRRVPLAMPLRGPLRHWLTLLPADYRPAPRVNSDHAASRCPYDPASHPSHPSRDGVVSQRCRRVTGGADAFL